MGEWVYKFMYNINIDDIYYITINTIFSRWSCCLRHVSAHDVPYSGPVLVTIIILYNTWRKFIYKPCGSTGMSLYIRGEAYRLPQ
jgi:hypothetical protein